MGTSHRLTPRISDPAPVTLGMQLSRYRRVRCIRLVGRSHFLSRYFRKMHARVPPAAPPGTPKAKPTSIAVPKSLVARGIRASKNPPSAPRAMSRRSLLSIFNSIRFIVFFISPIFCHSHPVWLLRNPYRFVTPARMRPTSYSTQNLCLSGNAGHRWDTVAPAAGVVKHPRRISPEKPPYYRFTPPFAPGA